MPITAIVALSCSDMACSLSLAPLASFHCRRGRSTAGPFHYRTSAAQNCCSAKLTTSSRFAGDKSLLYSVSPRLKGWISASSGTPSMPEVTRSRFGYREDRAVPAFDDSRALFVFDGVCVLCSGGAAFLMRHDRHARVNFAPVRSNLGQALYRHYAVEWNETYLLVEGGHAYTASAGYLRLCAVLGGAWHCLR